MPSRKSSTTCQPVEATEEAAEDLLCQAVERVIEQSKKHDRQSEVKQMGSTQPGCWKTSTIVLAVLGLALLGTTIGFLVAWITKDTECQSCTITTEPPGISTTIQPPAEDLRLPKSVKPLLYDLSIEPDHQNDEFNGKVGITVLALQKTDTIKLHSHHKLEIKTVEVVKQSDNAKVPRKDYYTEEKKQFLVIPLQNQLETGVQYIININYKGSFVNKTVGYYKGSYVINGRTSLFSATKFEPTYARQAFPCFDEPNLKAAIKMTITHDKNQKALANMPMKEETTTGNKTVTSFIQSPVNMSTYLVAWAVGEFDSIRDMTTRGKEVRVFARPDQVSQTKYALDIAVSILEFYERFFDIPFPLPKMDLIALPIFPTGAMENWGLIGFKDNLLLFDPKLSSADNKKRIAAVIGHELAHNWFGNLVTMDWWNDLWLNEGFASYIEYKGVANAEPGWAIDEHFLIDDLYRVMALDSLSTSHPIVQEVKNPDQITELFDTISYSKGASVLRMLEDTIGSEAFKTGIRNYLKKFKGGNAKTSDFWAEMDSALDKNATKIESVTKFMDKWTTDKNFPVVNTKIEYDQGVASLSLNQQRFLMKQDKKQKEDEKPWIIPIKLITEADDDDDDKEDFILNKKTEKFKLNVNLTKDEWFKLNPGQFGFYITNYTLEDWQKLTAALVKNPEVMPPTDRANLLFDAFQLAKSGQLDYKVAFDLSMYLKNEENLIPWTTANSALTTLINLMSNSDQKYIKELAKDLTVKVYRKLGWEFSGRSRDSINNKMLRTQIVGLACQSGNEDCLNEAASRLKQLIQDGKQVDAEIRSAVYRYGMQQSNDKLQWEWFFNRYVTETVTAEKSRLLAGLTSVQDTGLLLRLINSVLDDSKIAKQDIFTVLSSVANNIRGRDLVWSFIQDKWPTLVDMFTLNDRNLGRFVAGVISQFDQQRQLDQVEAFFKKYPDAGAGENARKQALDTIRNNIEWLKNNAKAVNGWLKDNTNLDKPWLNWRLNPLIRPINYSIFWDFTVKEKSYTGNVTIFIKNEVPILKDYLVLHSFAQTINKAEVYDLNTNQPLHDFNKTAFTYEPNQMLVVPLKKVLFPGVYKLFFEFNSNFSKDLMGIYESVYQANGKNHSMVVTQFETTYARRAFPCFDEPEFKATFDITVAHETDYNTTLSNMDEIKEREVYGDKYVYTFNTTLRMSTYLLALTISDYQFKNGTTENGINVRVYASPDQVHKTDFAVGVAVKVLDYYQKALGVDFPLNKLDLIAIPDFRYGAMENWGLVTFRESILLYDPSESTIDDKKSIASVIAHELAHMWFGNLVTLKWWEHTWLNEGFASFMPYLALSNVNETQNWRKDLEFGIGVLSEARSADSVESTHPIINPLFNADDIAAMFDDISYDKGASVIKTWNVGLLELIGNVPQGIRNYLRKYQYQNTLSSDLFNEFSQLGERKINVAELVNNWIYKPGYPCVTITRPNKYTINFKQERFFSDPTIVPKESVVWSIPMLYQSVDDKTPKLILLKEKEQNLTLPKADDLLKFNLHFQGLYIVNYPAEDWKKLTEKLQTKLVEDDESALGRTDRANLISDAFYLAGANRLNYEIVLNLTTYLVNEMDLIPWKTAKGWFNDVKRLIQNQYGIAWNAYIKNITEKAYKDVGWNETEKEDDRKKQLRMAILDLACDAESEECIKEAGRLFQEYKKNKTIPANLKAIVLRYGIFGSQNLTGDINFLWEKHEEARTTVERLQILRGIASTSDTTLIKEFLNKILNQNVIRSQDFFTALNMIIQNPVGLPLAWEFYKENYDALVKKFTISNNKLGQALYFMGQRFTSSEWKTELLDFYKKYPNAGASLGFRNQAVEAVDENIRWVESNVRTIGKWATDRCPQEVCPWKGDRLDEKVVPNNYDLIIQPNIDSGDFNGTVKIQVMIKREKTRYIIVHADNKLNVNNSAVSFTNNNTELAIESAFRYPVHEYWVVKMKQNLLKENYTLRFDFSGSMQDKLNGLYKSTYKNFDGNTVGLAATQFQSTHARKAMPCFDEPSFRSTFDVRIVHEKKYKTTLSNMDLVNQTESDNGLVISRFNRTVPMVSYLLAMVVSDFECLDNVSETNVLVRACASPVKKHKLDYALESASKTIDFFARDYFKVSYPLSKSDQVAIPDFAAGAMENWGLVLYRESALLYLDNDTTTQSQMGVAKIIAHELAHMWHGNWVTMKWWDELWLNEGFASFMQYKPVIHNHPEWKYEHHFISNEWIRALDVDSTLNTHPIINPYNPPKNGYIYSIVYAKGASVLRMLEFMMGPENFRLGISAYLQEHQYGNTVTGDLWTALQKQQDITGDKTLNISEVMKNWVTTSGLPVVTLTRINGTENKYTIKQQRFIRNDSEAGKQCNQTWVIPLSYYKNAGLNQESEIIYVESLDGENNQEVLLNFSKLLKINVNSNGYYIVNYDLQDWKLLINKLNDNATFLTPSDRANLVSDSFYLARSGLLSYSYTLDLSRYLVKEEHFIPWTIGNNFGFGLLRRMLGADNETQPLLSGYLNGLSKVQYQRLKFNEFNNSEDANDRRLRPEIIDLACGNGNEECLQEAENKFKKWRMEEEKMRPNLVAVTLGYGVRNNSDNWNYLLKKLLTASSSDPLKYYYQSALTAKVDDLDLLKRLMDNALNETIPKDQFYNVMLGVADNKIGWQLMWKFLGDNYKMLLRRMGEGGFESLLNTVTNKFATKDKRDEFTELFKTHPDFKLRPSKQKEILDKIDENIAWTSKNRKVVVEWLEKNQPKAEK